ncbi:hypothetical protein EGI99_19990 [Stutzerimonas stutzeri]|nr:hypothetical protein EGI99_19990 [Stutzerimonas stutzeri]
MPDGLVFALLGESLFLVWPRKSNQKEGHPASGFCFAKLPSLRRCSGGHREGTSLSLHSSLGVLPRAPLRNAYARPPDGEWGPSVPVDFRSRSFFACSGAHGHATSRAPASNLQYPPQ